MRSAILAAFLLCLPAVAPAQDWCGESGLNPTERTICNDALLRELDARLNALYARVDDRDLRLGQRAWLDRRDSCGRDLICIDAAYRARIDELQALAAPAGGPKRPWCTAGGLNPTERTICSRDLLADLDAAMAAVYGELRAAPGDESQARWLRGDRDACGTDTECIAASYIRRIIALGARLRSDG